MTVPVGEMPQRRIGPIRLVPGVRPAQVALFVMVVIGALCVVTFLPMMQAVVFTEILDVPRAEQGRLAGNLVTTQQLAVLCFIGLAGSLADRLGRRRILAVALGGYALCMALYPLASGVAALYLLQFCFGLMTTGHITGSATIIADYPDDASRGKFVAANLLLQAALSAVLVGWVGARLPGWLVAGGATPGEAGRLAFWSVAGVALCAAIATWLWLEDPPRRGAIPPATVSAGTPGTRPGVARSALRGFLDNLARVIAHGRRNPRFGLVMTMGFVIRSDYFVMLSFVSLWVVNAAAEKGVSSIEALKTAGLLMLTLKLATAAAQAVFGFVADRVERSRLLVTSLLLTGLSLVSTALVSDVFSVAMFVVVAVIGITESALIVCGQTMLGAEAPPELRGSAMGVFYFTGTLGVVIMSAVSGLLFDRIGYSAPFVMIGLLNLVFAMLGAAKLWRDPAPAPPSSARSGSGVDRASTAKRLPDS